MPPTFCQLLMAVWCECDVTFARWFVSACVWEAFFIRFRWAQYGCPVLYLHVHCGLLATIFTHKHFFNTWRQWLPNIANTQQWSIKRQLFWSPTTGSPTPSSAWSCTYSAVIGYYNCTVVGHHQDPRRSVRLWSHWSNKASNENTFSISLHSDSFF